MTNHTDPGGNDIRYDDPSMLFIYLIIFVGFSSIVCMCNQLCFGRNSICHDIRKYINKCFEKGCYHLYEEDEIFEYEIEEVTKEVGLHKIPTFANVNHYPVYCSICQEDHTNTVKVDCGHNFCKDCIMGYTKIGRECPNCRRGIKNIYEIEVLVFK
jgi:hypothetical protein